MCVCVHVCAPNCVSLNFQLGGPSNQRTDMVLQNYHISALCAVLAVHSLLCLHTALSLLTASGEQSVCVCQCISIASPICTYVVCTCRVTMMSMSQSEGRAGGEPDEEIPVGAGPDEAHESE